jgi:hypothetical protein
LRDRIIELRREFEFADIARGVKDNQKQG